MEKYELGLKHKSFSLNFNNGEIWCEQLDSLYDKRTIVMEKFQEDIIKIARPSTTSFLAINMAETIIDPELLEYVVDSLNTLQKTVCKVAFMGLNSKNQKYIKKKNKSVRFAMVYFDDYEKAKEWLVSKR